MEAEAQGERGPDGGGRAEGGISMRLGLRYWLTCLVVFPIGGVVIASVGAGAIGAAAGFELRDMPPQLLVGLMAAAALGAAAWAIPRDLRQLWTLTPTTLRSAGGLEIPLDAIESLVVGLPPEVPRFFQVLRINPSAYANLLRSRANVIVLRLGGRRRVVLGLHGLAANRDALAIALLDRCDDRLLEASSYSRTEIEALRWPPVNRAFEVACSDDELAST